MRAALALAIPTLAAAGCRAPDVAPPPEPWRVLLDAGDPGTFADWRRSGFGLDWELDPEAGRLVLPQGVPLAGVTYVGPPPAPPYELELDARKLYGADFFVGLTFPVEGGELTLVLGGWGGAVCGLSCLDGLDASANGTRTLRAFRDGESVRIALRVTRERVDVVLDGEPLLGADLADRAVSLRPEVLRSAPLGVASYATATEVRRLRWRPLRADSAHGG